MTVEIGNQYVKRTLSVKEGIVKTEVYNGMGIGLLSGPSETEARVTVNGAVYDTADGTLLFKRIQENGGQDGWRETEIVLAPQNGNFEVVTRYAIKDDIPVIRKNIDVINTGNRAVRLDELTIEALPVAAGRNAILLIEDDYVRAGTRDSMGASRSPWVEHIRDYAYEILHPREGTQTCGYPHELAYWLQRGDTFSSFCVYEFAVSNCDEEAKSLDFRRATRKLLPWSRERWIPCEIAPATDVDMLYKSIDSAWEAGYETVILNHGLIGGTLISPIFETYADYEPRRDLFPAGWDDIRQLTGYAHGKGLKIGFYTIYVSIWDDIKSRAIADNQWRLEFAANDDSQRWGTSLCPASDWGPYVNRRILDAVEKGNFDGIALDGPYYGDVCMAENHGHAPGASSRYLAWKRQTELYEALRAENKFTFAAQGFCAFFHGLGRVGQTGYDEGDFSDKGIWEQILNTRRGAYEYTKVFRQEQGVYFIPGASWLNGPSLEPYENNLEAYGAYLANCFGYGFDGACFQTVAFDGEKSRELIQKWIGFWKSHEGFFKEGYIIHLRKPDGFEPDAVFHIWGERGLAVAYNPCEVIRDVNFNLPLGDWRALAEEEGVMVSGTTLRITIPARGCRFVEVITVNGESA